MQLSWIWIDKFSHWEFRFIDTDLVALYYTLMKSTSQNVVLSPLVHIEGCLQAYLYTREHPTINTPHVLWLLCEHGCTKWLDHATPEAPCAEAHAGNAVG